MSTDTDFLEAATKELITLGVSFTRHIHDRTIAEPGADLAEASKAFERVTRGTRKGILLVRKLTEPPRHVAARKRILREVEDHIQRHAEDDEEADTLQVELLDRLDTLDLIDDIDSLSVETVIRDILRDLGLAHIRGANHPWKRRTPEDVADLNARAANPPRPRAAPPPPMPSAAPTVSAPTVAPSVPRPPPSSA